MKGVEFPRGVYASEVVAAFRRARYRPWLTPLRCRSYILRALFASVPSKCSEVPGTTMLGLISVLPSSMRCPCATPEWRAGSPMLIRKRCSLEQHMSPRMR